MTVPYDTFIGAFLAKITEYDLLDLDEDVRSDIIEDYMKRALSNTTFKKVCTIDFFDGADDESRTYEVDADEEIIDELVDIVSDGMLVQWLKPYVYRQENLEQILSTRDYILYSPAELLLRVGNAYKKAQNDYIQHIREYSYNHGDLTSLHL